MCVLVRKSTHRCPLEILSGVRGVQLSWMQSLFSQPERTNTRQRNTTSSLPHQVYQFAFADVRSNPPMAGLAALCLLLVFPLSHSQSSQSSLQSQQEVDSHQGAPSPPRRYVMNLLRKEEATHLNAKQTYVQVDQGNAKVGLFVAAALGTLALMAAVYCIYNKFYSKHQYLHTQLNDDSDFSTDPMDPPPVCFHTSTGSSAVDVQRAGYGSLSDTPSIISVPPSLSPPPSAMPFPPLFLSSHSLRTISAKDLEKSCA